MATKRRQRQRQHLLADDSLSIIACNTCFKKIQERDKDSVKIQQNKRQTVNLCHKDNQKLLSSLSFHQEKTDENLNRASSSRSASNTIKSTIPNHLKKTPKCQKCSAVNFCTDCMSDILIMFGLKSKHKKGSRADWKKERPKSPTDPTTDTSNLDNNRNGPSTSVPVQPQSPSSPAVQPYEINNNNFVRPNLPTIAEAAITDTTSISRPVSDINDNNINSSSINQVSNLEGPSFNTCNSHENPKLPTLEVYGCTLPEDHVTVSAPTLNLPVLDIEGSTRESCTREENFDHLDFEDDKIKRRDFKRESDLERQKKQLHQLEELIEKSNNTNIIFDYVLNGASTEKERNSQLFQDILKIKHCAHCSVHHFLRSNFNLQTQTHCDQCIANILKLKPDEELQNQAKNYHQHVENEKKRKREESLIDREAERIKNLTVQERFFEDMVALCNHPDPITRNEARRSVCKTSLTYASIAENGFITSNRIISQIKNENISISQPMKDAFFWWDVMCPESTDTSENRYLAYSNSKAQLQFTNKLGMDDISREHKKFQKFDYSHPKSFQPMNDTCMYNEYVSHCEAMGITTVGRDRFLGICRPFWIEKADSSQKQQCICRKCFKGYAESVLLRSGHMYSVNGKISKNILS